jgi:hypothetical protein
MYCQLLEEAVRQIKNEPRPTQPEAHVDIGISAFIPKQYIAGDRQRMDVYRRLTRCTSIEMLMMLEQDLKDAFGDPPRQAVLLLALTELRLLAGLFGVESIIRKEPDVVLTVRDAARAQAALAGAPGTLRVIDAQTVYLRMPASFMEPETLLMVLKNLMRQAYDREQRGEPVAQPGKAPPPKVHLPPKKPSGDGKAKMQQSASAPAHKEKPITADHPELKKLNSLREAGILTEDEFLAARDRLLAKI